MGELVDLTKFKEKKEHKERMKAKREMSLEERFEVAHPNEPLRYEGRLRPSHYHWNNSDGESGTVELELAEDLDHRTFVATGKFTPLVPEKLRYEMVTVEGQERALFEAIETLFEAIEKGFINNKEEK